MSLKLQVGEPGNQDFIAGWCMKDGCGEARSNRPGPKKRFKRHCDKRDNRGVRPCIDSLPNVFLCEIVRMTHSVNSGTC